MATVIKPKRSTVLAAVPSSGDLEVGEIAINLADGKMYSKNTSNTVLEVGGAGSATLQEITNNGASTTNDLTLNSGANIVFEGNLANAFETFLNVEEPTADRTLTLPNASGVISTTDDALAFSVVFGS